MEKRSVKNKEALPKTKLQLEALTEISKAITGELYLEDILKLIVTVTAQAMGSNLCSLILFDEKKQELSIRATQSVSESYIKKPALKIGEGIAGKVFQENKPRTVYDVLKEKEYKYKDIASKEGIASLLSVPLAVKGKVIGVINLYTSKPHKFSKDEINVLTTVANQAAMVIQNTELMVKSKVIQEELESRKMVERAKGILMKERNLNEDEAYRLIQKYSMDSRKSMRQIAEAIVLTQDMKSK